MVTEADRAHRRHTAPAQPGGRVVPSDPFRGDRDRIVGSPFFARLGGVTQVVSPGGSGLLLHNRLTHSLKAGQVAVALAEHLAEAALPPTAQVLDLTRGRAVVDFVASLTDSQARAMMDVLSGRSSGLWTEAFVL